jgi:hypothetical protein
MRIHEIRRVLKPRSEIFAYAADLANTEHWDPMVVSARQLDSTQVGTGAKFEMVVRFGGVTIPMVYEIAEYEPDYRLLLEGRSSGLEATDEIKFLEDGNNTIIDYTSNLRFHNLLRFAEPVLAPFIRRAGSRSVDALVAVLEG